MPFSIEAALVAWLPGAVGAPCFAEVPPERPGKFLTVERTGGSAAIGIDRPALAIQAWAGSKYDAQELALAARDAMLYRSVGIPQVRGCSINSGPYPFPDEDSGQHRYQLYVNMTTEI